MMRRVVCGVLMSLVAATIASAQVVNPARVAWDYTPEQHAQVIRYEAGYWLTGASEPFTVASIAKAAVSPEDADSYITALPRPALGSFTLKLRAYYPVAGGGEAATPWSNATDPFSLSLPELAGLRIVP